MTVPIEFSNIPSQNIVTPASRYRKQLVIYWSDKRYIAFNTYIRQPYVPDGKENIMMITKSIEYRPDLVSYDVYGFPDNWWRILEANKMIDIMEFKAGRTILIPNQVI